MEPSLHTAFPTLSNGSILKYPITDKLNLDSLFFRKIRTWSNNMRPEYPETVQQLSLYGGSNDPKTSTHTNG